MIPPAPAIARLRLSTDLPDPHGAWVPSAAADLPMRTVVVLRALEVSGEFLVSVDGEQRALRLPGDPQPGTLVRVPWPQAQSSSGVRLTGEGLETLARVPDPSGPRGAPAAVLEALAIEHAPEAAPRLALQIADRVEHSGLFYESHLAAWVDGSRPPEALRREPQGRFEPVAARDAITFAPDTEWLPAPLGSESSAATASSVPPALEPLVRDQLAALERHEVRFALPLGLERPAELVVSREPQGSNPKSREPSWNTRIKLTLPELGEVEARLHCEGRRVSVSLVTRDELSAKRLASASHELRERFGGQQLALPHFEVTHDGER